MASKVEEVQLWNRTLTPEEIQASMYGYNEMPEGLVAYYRPESATGTTVDNLAGDVDAYYRANNRSGNSGEFPVATNIQKTNGRETVEVTYNTPEEEKCRLHAATLWCCHRRFARSRESIQQPVCRKRK